jgi:hypothetical protein
MIRKMQTTTLLEVLEKKNIERRATTDTTILRPRPGARAASWSGVDAMKTALPENEAERLNALRQYQILDTPPEPAFDRIAEMAANFFQVPMAGVSLVDEDRVWFKSRVGIDVPQTARRRVMFFGDARARNLPPERRCP